MKVPEVFVLPAPGERLPADVADELRSVVVLRPAPLVVVAHFLLPPEVELKYLHGVDTQGDNSGQNLLLTQSWDVHLTCLGNR